MTVTLPPRLSRLLDLGVPVAMSAFDAKHIRLCNLTSVISGAMALIFFFWEIPLVTDWGKTTSKEAWIILLRGLSVIPFLIPLWLNKRGRYGGARFCFLAAGCLLILEMGWIFGGLAPSHLFLIVGSFVLPSLFPANQKRQLRIAVAVVVLTFFAFLGIQKLHAPIILVTRPDVLVAMESAVSIGALALALLAGKAVRDTTRRAEEMAIFQKGRADRLLLNILPPSVAARLMDDPSTIADGFQEVSVLFADLVDFTPLSEVLSPHELVQLMDRIFTQFDALVEVYGLEKIKTIGDAYMLAGGIPSPDSMHARKVASVALDMQETIASQTTPGGVPLQIRIGIASGPVVAGVIGKKKFLYDLWGDTVNTASRLESTCPPGRIQISEQLHAHLEGEFILEERGMTEIKGKGMLRTWFVNGKVSE